MAIPQSQLAEATPRFLVLRREIEANLAQRKLQREQASPAAQGSLEPEEA